MTRFSKRREVSHRLIMYFGLETLCNSADEHFIEHHNSSSILTYFDVIVSVSVQFMLVYFFECELIFNELYTSRKSGEGRGLVKFQFSDYHLVDLSWNLEQNCIHIMRRSKHFEGVEKENVPYNMDIEKNHWCECSERNTL